MIKTQSTNILRRKLIANLHKLSVKFKIPLLQRVALELARPKRIRRSVNLSKIDRFTKEGEVVVVPGKVLSLGELTHKVTIYADSYSTQSLDKIKKNKGVAKTFYELGEKIDKKLISRARLIG